MNIERGFIDVALSVASLPMMMMMTMHITVKFFTDRLQLTIYHTLCLYYYSGYSLHIFLFLLVRFMFLTISYFQNLYKIKIQMAYISSQKQHKKYLMLQLGIKQHNFINLVWFTVYYVQCVNIQCLLKVGLYFFFFIYLIVIGNLFLTNCLLCFMTNCLKIKDQFLC